MVVLAEIEIFHSRPVAPTRRVALGHRELPVEPAPGFGVAPSTLAHWQEERAACAPRAG